jgi:uncharacterized protein
MTHPLDAGVVGKSCVTVHSDFHQARAVLRIDVNEVYFHCGKAAMRSRLWSNDGRVTRSSFPSIGEINHEQTSLGVPESQAAIEAIYKEQL